MCTKESGKEKAVAWWKNAYASTLAELKIANSPRTFFLLNHCNVIELKREDAAREKKGAGLKQCDFSRSASREALRHFSKGDISLESLESLVALDSFLSDIA